MLRADAPKAAERSLEIANNQYQEGTASNLNAVTAQSTALPRIHNESIRASLKIWRNGALDLFSGTGNLFLKCEFIFEIWK